MTENEVLKDLKNYQGILKAKARVNAGVNPEIALDAITQAIEIIQQYRAIGTIEELQALKEKSVAKKPIQQETTEKTHYRCPCCNNIVQTIYRDGVVWGCITNYCRRCGQALEK